jgi:hypothetical protein
MPLVGNHFVHVIIAIILEKGGKPDIGPADLDGLLAVKVQ